MTDQDTQQQGRSVPARTVVAGVVAVLVIVLIIQNAQRITVDWYFWETRVPLSAFVIVIAVLSFAVGWLLGRARAKRT